MLSGAVYDIGVGIGEGDDHLHRLRLPTSAPRAAFQLLPEGRSELLKPLKWRRHFSLLCSSYDVAESGYAGKSRTSVTMVMRFMRESDGIVPFSASKVGYLWMGKTDEVKDQPLTIYDPYSTTNNPTTRPNPYR